MVVDGYKGIMLAIIVDQVGIVVVVVIGPMGIVGASTTSRNWPKCNHSICDYMQL
jgi:hypothetical protein